MLYECRIYDAVPGNLPALNERFANHTTGFFRKHGIGMLGFWTDEIGTSNRLTYIVTFENMADREARWGAFQGRSRLAQGQGRLGGERTPGRPGHQYLHAPDPLLHGARHQG